ncbi:MAG: HAD-IIB family hydrolase [Acidobacteria bacterium]|nr:HAD-IIB family hydrolase [Acidobacteriota bacterium]
MAIRLVGIDIDGTLLDSRGSLPDANRTAIERVMARNVEVLVATGRSFHFARPVVEPLPDAVFLLVSNGALVKARDGTTHVRRLLPVPVAREVLEATKPFRGTAGVIFERNGHEQIVCEGMDWQHPNRRGYFERNRACISDCEPLEASLVDDPIQVMFNGAVRQMRDLYAFLRQMPAADRFAVALTEYVNRDFSLLDVTTKGCSKGSGLSEWARMRGFSRAEVMAIGDNFNDREMLEFAGTRVVMGNAVPALKAFGWPVTATNDEAGVARALEEFVLGNGRG